jgi:hypothetical protein
MTARLGLLLLFLTFGSAAVLPLTSASAGAIGAAEAAVPVREDAAVPVAVDPADALFTDAGLDGILAREAFDAAYASLAARGLDVNSGTLAIADMREPSTAQRLVLVDLASREVLLRTWVAHGQGSGGLTAERFSNAHGSHQTSLGLYRVGAEIVSPKHGAALLLHGLDAGVNDQARAREVIIHGADYVSEDFIARTGRLGRSWGCPAVPRAEIARVIEALAGDGLLFVYGA